MYSTVVDKIDASMHESDPRANKSGYSYGKGFANPSSANTPICIDQCDVLPKVTTQLFGVWTFIFSSCNFTFLYPSIKGHSLRLFRDPKLQMVSS